MNQHYPFRLFPYAASTIAPQVDAIFWVLVGLSGAIFLTITGLILYFCARFHNAPISAQPLRRTTRRAMELTWTIIPFLGFMTIFAWGAWQYFKMHVPPGDSMNIFVTAKQWMWKFQHPNGIREIDTLHVPLGQPVKLIMASEDVIHSLFIPAFRVKQDVVPGRYNYEWFEATMPGEFHLFCTQYCGTAHANMRGTVIVMTPQDYARWEATRLATEPREGPSGMAAQGRALYHHYNCISCHDTHGVKAPELSGLYMSRVRLDTGNSMIADEDYIRQSILNPSAKIVAGYKNIMPSFQGQISEEELLQLVSYIESLQQPEKKP